MSPQKQAVAVDVAMADHSPGFLFERAIEAIQYTISDEDRRTFRHFNDVKAMLDGMRSMCLAHQDDSERLQACIQKIASFAHAFAPYFDVVGLFANVHREWISCFWGSIALMIRVCLFVCLRPSQILRESPPRRLNQVVVFHERWAKSPGMLTIPYHL